MVMMTMIVTTAMIMIIMQKHHYDNGVDDNTDKVIKGIMMIMIYKCREEKDANNKHTSKEKAEGEPNRTAVSYLHGERLRLVVIVDEDGRRRRLLHFHFANGVEGHADLLVREFLYVEGHLGAVDVVALDLRVPCHDRLQVALLGDVAGHKAHLDDRHVGLAVGEEVLSAHVEAHPLAALAGHVGG